MHVSRQLWSFILIKPLCECGWKISSVKYILQLGETCRHVVSLSDDFEPRSLEIKCSRTGQLG